MRPIDADALIDKCGGWYVEEGTESGFIGTLKNLLATEPTVQPEPHEGHWIWVAGDLECSECHTRYPDLYPDYDNAVACPHCGAKMKGATP